MLIAAAFIIIGIGFIHSLLGEHKVIKPILAKTELSPYMARLIRIAWHITTFFWFAIAAQLIAMHIWPDAAYRSFLIIMAVTFGFSTIISLISSKGKHISWTGFGGATILLGYLAFIAS